MNRIAIGAVCVFLVGLILACGQSAQVSQTPSWACPSPTPLPYGSNGPVKSREAQPTAIPSGPVEYADTYYEEWEREYGNLGGPPFPSPTPYGTKGTSFVLGQRVAIGQLHALVQARSGQAVTASGVPAGSQMYIIGITWINDDQPVDIDYVNSVRLRSVTAANGAILTDSTWGVSDLARDLANLRTLPGTIPSGESRVELPVIAPAGKAKTVDITFVGTQAAATNTAATATSTARNSGLQNTQPTYLTVQWTDTQLGVGQGCSDPGVTTRWDDGSAWGSDAPIAVAAPPGASRVVQIALNQVGKTYVWGSKGPETFDCSGLMTWSYARIDIPIPQGTAGQWPKMTPVSQNDLQPGDLIFFTVETPGKIDHVGMLIGDQNGDGRWDMVHASAPCCGVRVEYDVFNARFWKGKIAGFRTAR